MIFLSIWHTLLPWASHHYHSETLTYLPTYPSIHPSVLLSVCSSIHLPIHFKFRSIVEKEYTKSIHHPFGLFLFALFLYLPGLTSIMSFATYLVFKQVPWWGRTLTQKRGLVYSILLIFYQMAV